MHVRTSSFHSNVVLVNRVQIPVGLAKKVYLTFKRNPAINHVEGSNTRIRWAAKRLIEDYPSGSLIEMVVHARTGSAEPRSRLFEIGYTAFD